MAEADPRSLSKRGPGGRMPAGTVTASEAARQLHVSFGWVVDEINRGALSAVRAGQRWAIAEADLQSLMETDRVPRLPAGALSTSEAARRLGVSRAAIDKHIKLGGLPAVRVGRRRWAIAEADLRSYRTAQAAWERPAATVSAFEAARRLGVSPYWVLRRIKSGRVPAVRAGQGWALHEADIASLAEMRGACRFPVGTVGTSEAAKRLGVSTKPLLKLIHGGQLPAFRIGMWWAIAETGLQSLIEEPAGRALGTPFPAGTVPVATAATRLGVMPATLRRVIADGGLPAARVGYRLIIAEADLEAIIEKRAAGRTPAGAVNTVEAARRLGVSRPWISRLISTGLLAASPIGDHWAIAETELQPLIDKRQNRIARLAAQSSKGSRSR